MITLILLILTTKIIPASDGVIVYVPVILPSFAEALRSPYGYYMPACPAEDLTNCYWDATTRATSGGIRYAKGNGLGNSFISTDN